MAKSIRNFIPFLASNFVC